MSLSLPNAEVGILRVVGGGPIEGYFVLWHDVDA